MQNNKNKVVVIGLDGVDPDLLDKFIAEGLLPNFKRLITGGAYGRIKSSIPIITTVTWTSFITGMNPGKHGIFGFVNFKKDSYALKIINSLDRKVEGLWGLLNRYGKTSGIFNLPSLFPAEKINKFMVCGMLTPNKKCRFVYPAPLQDELLGEIPDYEIDVGVIKAAYDSKAILLKNMYFLTEKRYQATKYLLNKYPCDVFISIVTETDRMQHYFLNDQNALREYFKYLDNKMGELLGLLDKEATVFVLSDHGMGPVNKFIYINKFLIEKGLLRVNQRSANYFKHSIAKKAIQLISTMLVWFKFDVEKIKKALPQNMVSQLTYLYCYYGGVDWAKTKAYFCSGIGEGIVINTKKRFPLGIVQDSDYEQLREDIIKSILLIKDPDTNESIVENAYKREDLLKGDYTPDAPDIILKLRDGYATNESVDVDRVLVNIAQDEMLVAEHRLEGIIIGYGKHIKPASKVGESSILDIAPTILRLLGIPIPLDFDGRPLEEIIQQGEGISGSPSLAVSQSELLRNRIKELKLSGKIK